MNFYPLWNTLTKLPNSTSFNWDTWLRPNLNTDEADKTLLPYWLRNVSRDHILGPLLFDLKIHGYARGNIIWIWIKRKRNVIPIYWWIYLHTAFFAVMLWFSEIGIFMLFDLWIFEYAISGGPFCVVGCRHIIPKVSDFALYAQCIDSVQIVHARSVRMYHMDCCMM